MWLFATEVVVSKSILTVSVDWICAEELAAGGPLGRLDAY